MPHLRRSRITIPAVLAAAWLAGLGLLAAQGSTPAAGSYRGLGTRTAGPGPRELLVRLSILPSGTFTGLVNNGGQILLRGQFAADGSFHHTNQYGAKTVVVDLAGGADSLSGTISIAGTVY